MENIPEIGDVVVVNDDPDHRYRVNGYIKAVKARPNSVCFKDEDGCNHIFCPKEEATHVYGSGVCGFSEKFANVKVVGRVNWTPEHIKELEQSAARLHGVKVF